MHYYDFVLIEGAETACGIPINPDNWGEPVRHPHYGAYTYFDPDNKTEMTSYELDKIKCEGCLRFLKSGLYYCEIHGFIGGAEVTFDEKCDYCGRAV